MQTVFALLNLSRALSSATFTRPLDCVSQAADIVDQFGATESLAGLAYVESGDVLELFRCDDAQSAALAATAITELVRKQ